ncbi:MAG: hypothetical protein IJK18_04690 [Clostridia bacterium]|nr:hypothetical protein [Clostridia bacterium]
MGKQRTEFFKKCIIIFDLILIISDFLISIFTILMAYENNINALKDTIILCIILSICGIIVINIILYFLWSVLKTLEEIRDCKQIN